MVELQLPASVVSKQGPLGRAVHGCGVFLAGFRLVKAGTLVLLMDDTHRSTPHEALTPSLVHSVDIAS